MGEAIVDGHDVVDILLAGEELQNGKWDDDDFIPDGLNGAVVFPVM